MMKMTARPVAIVQRVPVLSRCPKILEKVRVGVLVLELFPFLNEVELLGMDP
jgi:hypothetical protein